jgi:hypothetical protein
MKEVPVWVPDESAWLSATVSDEDYDEAMKHTWSLQGGKGSRGKYPATQVEFNGKFTTLYLHRLVAARMGLIEQPIGKEGVRWVVSIDHCNAAKLDSRRENLRLKTRSEQMLNTNDELRVTNTSGYRGVNYTPGPGRVKAWRAKATKNYKQITIGWYATYEEAVEARIRWDEAQAASSD